MAIPEFISVLRKIRDVIYPEVNALYEDSLVLKESIDVGKVEFDADLIKFNTDYSDFNTKKSQVDASVLSASQSASSASQSALIATNKSNEIKAITAQSTTGVPGTSASASYNPTDGKFTFVIPQGSKGDKGESFTVNSSGATAQRALYDAQPAGWSFLDITTSTLYFKASNTSGDWSSGVPFGRGDKGDTGDIGVGIQSFTYISTNHISELPAQSGGTDTYRVTLTNALTFDYQVYNGLDADLTYVDTSIANVQANVDTVSTQLASHIPLSGVTAYNLLQGNLSVSNEVITNGFGIFTYTGNSTTPPSINLGMDITSQWGNDVSETFSYLIKIKSRSVSGDWIYVDSVRGITKYTSSNTTAVEGTDANMFTLNTVAGVTTLNIGTSTKTNMNGVNYVVEVYQTTHKKTGVTNQGKAYTEHYNPFTGFTIIKYEGSGIVGHEIPHSLGRKLACTIIKILTSVQDWWVNIDSGYMALNTINPNTAGQNESNDNSIVLGSTTGFRNTSTNQHIMYGWANSYFDETNKLIGNYEIGVYQGTGVAGNKVTTRGKPAWAMLKRLDGVENWIVIDNQRNSFDNYVNPNLSSAEATYDHFDINIDGFTFKQAGANISGGQYLYMVVYDNDSGSGKSKYPKATDTSNVQINNALIPLAHGVDSNGSKNSIVIANETITGLTYTQGKNYLYKTDTGYGVKPYEPRYLSSELVRTYASEAPEYFDVLKNKWFSTSGHGELNGNKAIQTNDTASWTVSSNGTLSWVQGRYTMARSVLNNDVTFTRTFTGLTAGVPYTFALNTSRTGNYWFVSLDGGMTKYTITDGICYVSITPITTSITFTILQTNANTIGITLYVNSISIYKSDIVPTTEITESRNYLNHIVHADQNGQVAYVEELPKIEYKDIIKANEFRGKNACTAWVNLTGSASTILIRDKHNIAYIIRVSIGVYDIYFEKPMDNINYSISRNIQGQSYGLGYVDESSKTLNKCTLYILSNTGTAIDGYASIQIFGGKN